VLHARGGAMNAGALAQRFECSWPTVTRHLQRLLEAGLVVVERRGRERWYRLDAARLRDVTSCYLDAFSEVSSDRR
jgi:DNA-binding transcriptional ArsR family regulator